MPRATCSTGLPLPGSPHFKLNKVQEVKEPRQSPAVSSPGDPFWICHLLLLVQGQIDDFVHQNKATSSSQSIPRLLLSASAFLK